MPPLGKKQPVKNPCQPGWHWDYDGGVCRPDEPPPEGFIYDYQTGKLVPKPVPGKTATGDPRKDLPADAWTGAGPQKGRLVKLGANKAIVPAGLPSAVGVVKDISDNLIVLVLDGYFNGLQRFWSQKPAGPELDAAQNTFLALADASDKANGVGQFYRLTKLDMDLGGEVGNGHPLFFDRDGSVKLDGQPAVDDGRRLVMSWVQLPASAQKALNDANMVTYDGAPHSILIKWDRWSRCGIAVMSNRGPHKGLFGGWEDIGSALLSALSGMVTGAITGFKLGGVWGAIIGGAIGFAIGLKAGLDALERAQLLAAAQAEALTVKAAKEYAKAVGVAVGKALADATDTTGKGDEWSAPSGPPPGGPAGPPTPEQPAPEKKPEPVKNNRNLMIGIAVAVVAVALLASID